MKAYMGWAGEPEDGAVLILAHDTREAKRLVWPVLRGWTDCDYIDVRVRWLKDDVHLLRTDADQGALERDEAHCIESPTTCRDCELWGDEMDEQGRCEQCRCDHALDIADLDSFEAPRGRCELCGHEDARHRRWDAWLEEARHTAPETIAATHDVPVDYVEAVCELEPYQ